MNAKLFRAKCVEKGLTYKAVSVELNVTPETVHNKIRGRSTFSAEQIRKLVELLNLNLLEYNNIFYDGILPIKKMTLACGDPNNWGAA